jgi:hypothetical protein
MVDSTDPIIPSPEIKEGTVDPMSRAITITKDDITVISDHWSKRRLNRKYTTVDMRSPFYYLETWDQGFTSEVFHLTITNNTSQKVIVLFKEITLEDERDYVYRVVTDMNDFKYKFATKQMMDLRTKRGLQIAPQIILSEKLGQRAEILPGETVDGFIPFTTPSTQAEKMSFNVVLEKEPESATATYEKVIFRFDYKQDLILLKRQPATKRT